VPRFVLLGRAAILSDEEEYGFKDGPRASRPFGKGRDGCEQPTSQLHARLERKVVEDVGDILEWGSG
jgi:hypothetical protein